MVGACIFYVAARRDGSFGICFRGLSGEMIFSAENSDEAARLALNEAQRRERFPEDYRIAGNRVPDAPAADRPKRKAAPAAEAPKKSSGSGKKAPKVPKSAPQPAAVPQKGNSAEIRYVDSALRAVVRIQDSGFSGNKCRFATIYSASRSCQQTAGSMWGKRPESLVPGTFDSFFPRDTHG